MEPSVRLQFLKSALDGDADAHLVFADLLEEEGDTELAQWCRDEKDPEATLDFILGALPYRMTLKLACDFVAAVGFEFKLGENVNRSLKEIKNWLTLVESEPEEAYRRINYGNSKRVLTIPSLHHEKFKQRPLAKHCVQYVEDAVMWAEIAFASEQAGDFDKQRNAAKESLDSVRRSRRYINEYIWAVETTGNGQKKARYEKWWLFMDPDEVEFNRRKTELTSWQIQHTQRFLLEMLES